LIRLTAGRSRAVQELSAQADYCEVIGSPLYATILRHAAADAEAGGIVWEVVRGRESRQIFSARSLRVMAAVHRLVLTGRARSLARHYPSVGGDGDAEAAWPRFRRVLETHRDEVRRLARLSCQTNEVGRAASLLGGFLLVARETGMPLRVLEIGASAGLNLRWDHFRYQQGRTGWGDRRSPVRIVGAFEGTPPLSQRAKVVGRAGCDLVPIDPISKEGRLRLMSSVWADQASRFRLLEGALEVAARVPLTVERANALSWLRRRLARPSTGVATIVFHSIFATYLTPEGVDAIDQVFAEAGERATKDAPLARLSMEPGWETGPEMADVRLRTWPGGEWRLIARTGYHGRPVIWLGG
jgi:hypothetical protein